jgi:hypothetical protein
MKCEGFDRKEGLGKGKLSCGWRDIDRCFSQAGEMELVNVNFPTPRPERDGWQLGGVNQLLVLYVIEEKRWKEVRFRTLWKALRICEKGQLTVGIGRLVRRVRVGDEDGT